MTNYLKSILFFLSLFLFFSCSEEESFILNEESIAIEDISNVSIFNKSNGVNYEVTTEFIKKKWESELLEEGIEVELEKFIILESKDKLNSKNYYFLKAISKDGTLETGAFLNKIETKNLSISASFELAGKKCSCTGCTNGCAIEVVGSKCTCTSCIPRGGKCTKKEEQVVE